MIAIAADRRVRPGSDRRQREPRGGRSIDGYA